jgi:hypothetical protein
MWNVFIWLRIHLVPDSYEHGNEPPGSIKGGELLDQLNDHQHLKNDLIRQCVHRPCETTIEERQWAT